MFDLGSENDIKQNKFKYSLLGFMLAYFGGWITA